MSENLNSIVEIEGIKIRVEDLFRAPEKDGAVVSVRVHRSVKEALARLAEKEGLHGVSELVRYLIAGYLMGKYKIEKPNPKVLAPPIYLNVNVNLSRKSQREETQQSEKELEKLRVAMELEELIKEAQDFIDKARLKLVRVRGNEYARKLRTKLFKAMIRAVKYGLEDYLFRLRSLFEELNNLMINSVV